MSLISNALKKAQRQRAESETAAIGPDAPIRRGKSGMPTETLILLIAGAAVIVVLSVVLTVYLLRPAPAPVSEKLDTPVQLAATTPAPEITAPVIKMPEPELVSTAPITTDVAPNPVAATTPANTPIEDVPSVTPIPQATTLEPARADERVYTFIDNLQVTGVRSSGNDSKVLMNDRVYRVNDIVDRALVLRLIKVEPDRLIFEDANGITYTKTF